MKKIVLILFALAMATTSFGQNLGIRAGLNIANLTASQDGTSITTDSRASFHVGVATQHQILRVLPLYIESGLYLSGRGGTIKGFDGDKNKFNMLYLQLPVLVSFHFDVKSVSIQPYAGAYYGVGIHGKGTVDGEKINLFKKTTIDDTTYDQSVRRSEAGLRFGVGVAIKKHYYVGVGYDLGLTNIAKIREDNTKLKNGAFYLSLGYNF